MVLLASVMTIVYTRNIYRNRKTEREIQDLDKSINTPIQNLIMITIEIIIQVTNTN